MFGIGNRQESELPAHNNDSDTEMGRINEENSQQFQSQYEESKDTMNEQKIPKSDSKGPKKIGRWT